MRQKPQSDLSQARKECLKNSLKKASQPQVMETLASILDRTDFVETDQLYTFSILLGHSAVIPMVDLMGRIDRAKVRRTLCEGLIRLCNENPEPLLKGLKDKRWYVIRNVLYVLGRIGKRYAIEHLSPLVTHNEDRVRKELIHTLDAIHDDKAKDLLVLLAEDPDPGIRTQAVRSLAASRYEPALDPLLKAIHLKSFVKREMREKKEWFGALGQIGGGELIPLFQRVLVKGVHAWVKRNAKEELALCAVEGLRRVGGVEAEDVLMNGKKASRKRIREACARAINDLARVADAG